MNVLWVLDKTAQNEEKLLRHRLRGSFVWVVTQKKVSFESMQRCLVHCGYRLIFPPSFSSGRMDRQTLTSHLSRHAPSRYVAGVLKDGESMAGVLLVPSDLT